MTVPYLVAGARPLTGRIGGFSGFGAITSGAGPYKPASLGVPGPGEASLQPGVPLPDGSWMDVVTPKVGSLLDVRVEAGPRVDVLPLQIRVVPSIGARSIPAVAGPEADSIFRHGIAAYVQVVPARRVDARRFGTSRFLLEAFDDGSPLVWERLPDPGIEAQFQVRHVTVGPD